jgi:isopropylmalate/homocitrate/citramalate synthase
MKNDDMTSKLQALHEVLTRVRVPPAYNPGKWFAGPVNFAPQVRAGMNLPERVEICDVTLREASQAYFGKKEIISLAQALDEAGVAVIQFLSPKNEGERSDEIQTCKELGKLKLSAKLQVYGVSSETEMDLAAEYGADSVCYTVFPIPQWQPVFAARRKVSGRSEVLEKSQAVRTEDDLIEYMEKMAQAARQRGLKARPITNFFAIAPIEFVIRYAQACERAQVYALNLTDPAGNMGPAGYRYVISEVKKAAPRLTVGVHAHNDLGLATANALAAVEGGASQVDVTINGTGARAGNATMAEVVVALEALYRVKTGMKLERLTGLAKMFEDLSRWPTPKDKPLVGEYAFTDASETHSFLLQADPLLFAPVRPELVGNKRRSHIDLKSGLNTLKMKLHEVGIVFPDDKLPILLSHVKSKLEIRRRLLTEEELRDCVAEINNAASGSY